jgi:hypothetical protein
VEDPKIFLRPVLTGQNGITMDIVSKELLFNTVKDQEALK